jgi:hypothetical protein
MNRSISLHATPVPKRVTRAAAGHRFALWAFVAVLIVIACTVSLLDTSFTPEQRIEQLGLFP